MTISLIVASLGIGFAFLVYLFRKLKADNLASAMNKLGLYDLSFNKFYIDEIYNAILYKPFMWWCSVFSKIDWDYYDQKFIDGWGWVTMKISELSGYSDYNWLDQIVVDGFAKIANYFSKELKQTQSGVIQNYVMGGVFGLLIIMIIFQSI